ncbi:MAG: hypothetical protein FJZ56_05720 [Chlamydiae bacterium]|nr:hypothetical protein [Chlamydiota bacterium]
MIIDLSLQSSLEFTNLSLEGMVEVDFGFIPPFFHPMRLSSYSLALKQFSSEVLEPQKDKISGLILYRGDLDAPFETAQQLLSDLAESLQSLGSIVPETMPLYAHFRLLREYSLAEQAILFSKARFLHLQIVIENSPLPFQELQEPQWGVLIPQVDRIDYTLVNSMLESMINKKIAFRLLPELFACELWHGIDYILFAGSCLSKEGKRMLLGFEAAGGDTIDYEEDNRGRGI